MKTPPAPPTPPAGQSGGTPSNLGPVISPGAAGYLGYAIKKYYWPQVECETVEQWAATHQKYAEQLDVAADESDRKYAPKFDELLKGSSGQTAQAVLNKIVKSWRQYASNHQDAAKALGSVAGYLQGLQTDLTDIITVNDPKYNSAVNNHDVPAMNRIVAEAADTEAHGAALYAARRITMALGGNSFGNIPTTPPLQLPLGIVPENPYTGPWNRHGSAAQPT